MRDLLPPHVKPGRFHRLIPGEDHCCDCGATDPDAPCRPAVRFDVATGPLVGADLVTNVGRVGDGRPCFVDSPLLPDYLLVETDGGATAIRFEGERGWKVTEFADLVHAVNDMGV